MPLVSNAHTLPVILSLTSGFSFLSFKINPVSGSIKTGAFVYLAKYSRSILPAFISTLISDNINKPSVPGVTPSHSSATALYPVRIGLTPTIFAPRSLIFPIPILIGLLS